MTGRKCKAAAIIAAAAVMGMLAGCSSNSHNTVIGGSTLILHKITPDPRSDDELAQLLPPDTFTQNEFPRPYVINMMRSCISVGNANKNNIYAQAGKTDQYCSCAIRQQVHGFTLSEFIEAGRAHWDPKTVPDSAKKLSGIIASCTQSALR